MSIRILIGDCREVLRTLPAESVHCVVTSPPYFGLRDYGTRIWKGGNPACEHKGSERYYTEKTAAVSSAGAFSKPGEANKDRLKQGRWREGGTCICGAVHYDPQIGLEPTPDAFVAELVAVFREVRRILRSDGTCWLNLGDSYNNRTKVRTTSHQPALNGFVDDNWAERAARGGVRMSRSDGDLKEKDLLGVPWMVAFALRADGWYLRQDIIWSKPNPMPESVRDRCTKAHEYLFLLSKSERYYYDAAAIAEPSNGWNGSIFDGERDLIVHPNTGRRPNKQLTWAERKELGEGSRRGFSQNGPSNIGANQESRNKRSVWEVSTQPYSEAHFATFPPALIEPCIKAGCPQGGTVLDPFGGAGTTGLVADRLQRNAVLIELNPAYAAMAERRIAREAGMFGSVNTETSAQVPA